MKALLTALLIGTVFLLIPFLQPYAEEINKDQTIFKTPYQYLILLPFRPPKPSDIPKDKHGEVIRKGLDIFTNTNKYRKQLRSNGLVCSNCHLDAGRKHYSAPMWAAYPLYPQYREKNKQSNSIDLRIRDCIQYSLNGVAPAADSELISALKSYFAWLSTGAPIGIKLAGRGYPEIATPLKAPDDRRGQKIYQQKCSVCHGEEGAGLKSNDRFVFPPLWGQNTYNWGAGMHRLDTAAAFIKHNMPLNEPNSLSLQEAWDLAHFINGKQRPQDPRFSDSIEQTKHTYHQHPCRYGD